MGKTRDLFKKIGDTKGIFDAKISTIKDRNGKDLTEAAEIKNRWQDYTEDLYKKGLQSLLFSGNLHSVGYIFPFLPCLSLLTFPQLFVKPSQTTTLPSGISFSWGWFWSLSPIQRYEPLSIVLQTLPTRSNPLNLFVTSPV